MPVRMANSDEWRKFFVNFLFPAERALEILFLFSFSCCILLALAEIISKRENDGKKEFYVHYIDCKYF